MGLRSPQQLEQVQLTAPNMPQVEAGKPATLDLATPVNNFMTQKAIGDQIDAANKVAINRKDALAKIKSKYAVEMVTSEYKSRLAALVGNNAVTESKGLVEQATRAVEDLVQKAPPELADQVQRDSKIKIQELQMLMQDKINIEGRKDAVNTGNSMVKTLTLDAASKFLDLDAFKSMYNKTYEYSRYTEAMKGGSEDVQVFNSAAVASNSVLEGVKFSLSQAATPDRVAEIEKYYRESILTDPGIHVNTDDQTKINNAFTTAREKTEGDLGYLLAAKAQELGLNPELARDYIFKNARGSVKAATQGFNLYNQLETARKAEIEKTDREKFGEVVKLMREGDPKRAENVTRLMSPEGERKARAYLNEMEGGTARAYTDPKDRAALNKLDRTNKEALMKENLDKYYLSREDRRYWEARQRVYGREVQDRKFAIDNGALEEKSTNMGMTIARAKLGLRLQVDPKMSAQVELNARDIFYEVRDKYPTAEAAVLMGKVRERMEDPKYGILKGITEPNVVGQLLNNIGFDTSNNSWFNREVIGARPSYEFKSQEQTGGKDAVRVPEPTVEEILQWKSIAKKKGADIDDGTAARQIQDFWRKNPGKIPPRK